jgi:hypothetical protein
VLEKTLKVSEGCLVNSIRIIRTKPLYCGSPRLERGHVSTGGRISELLSLTIGDVYQNRRAVTDLLYDRSIVKGGEVSRAVPVNTDGMRAIDELVSA